MATNQYPGQEELAGAELSFPEKRPDATTRGKEGSRFRSLCCAGLRAA